MKYDAIIINAGLTRVIRLILYLKLLHGMNKISWPSGIRVALDKIMVDNFRRTPERIYIFICELRCDICDKFLPLEILSKCTIYIFGNVYTYWDKIVTERGNTTYMTHLQKQYERCRWYVCYENVIIISKLIKHHLKIKIYYAQW